MPYFYLDDIAAADVAFSVLADGLEELFVSACDALANTMVSDLNTIAPNVHKRIEAHAESVEMLLFRFLNDCVFYKDAEQLLLRVHEVTVQQSESSTDQDGTQSYRLEAVLFGEKIDPHKHDLLVDVKSATLCQFSVVRSGSGWKAQVVLDV